jgi:hypothetical protein
MSKAALVFGVCACTLFLPGAGDTSAKQDRVPEAVALASEWGLMTYWEAKAAGFHVSPLPSETGIRPCTEADYNNPGFRSAEAIEQASSAYYAKWGEAEGPAYCQDDPRTLLYGYWPGRSSILGRPQDRQ